MSTTVWLMLFLFQGKGLSMVSLAPRGPLRLHLALKRERQLRCSRETLFVEDPKLESQPASQVEEPCL